MVELTQTQNTFGSFPECSIRLSIRPLSYPCVGKDDGQNKVTIGKETAAARMDSSNHSLGRKHSENHSYLFHVGGKV